ncbi:HNH endonuclease [Lactiplantibacillus plantarum]|uniref:HNH endonuclease n=1 Tax=Lactiplantibacillus plantarum TaxID=1590 RepID=UPI001651A5B9
MEALKKRHYIHRLVAKAFIKNYSKLNEINHKDENKSNNNVSNLEWCSRKYNVNYGITMQKCHILKELCLE